VLLARQTAGTLSIALNGPGERHVELSYLDNARRVTASQHFVLRPDGVPVRMRGERTTWDQAQFQEWFEAGPDRARWKSPADSSDAPLLATAFYWSVTGTAEEAALLARVALSRQERSVDLLPAGRASARVAATVMLPKRDAGQPIRLVTIEGLEFLPLMVWLDRDGELFARGDAWFLVLRRGWEDQREVLLRYQREEWSRWQESVREAAVQSRAGRVVVRDATVFDAASGTTRPHRRVVLEGERIAAVVEERAQTVPPRATVIDAHGDVLIPGLIDMHQHLGEADGLLNIAAGVTTIRDPAPGDPTTVRDLKRRFDDGTQIGPRVFPVGLLEGKNPLGDPGGWHVATEADAKKAVDSFRKRGYRQVKYYNFFPRELVPGITRYAHAHGLRVSGHLPFGMTVEELVAAGVDEIHHLHMLYLSLLGDEAWRLAGPAERYALVPARAGDIDLSSDEVTRLVASLSRAHAIVDPTINIYEETYLPRPGHLPEGYALIADRMPVAVRRSFAMLGLPVSQELDEPYGRAFAASLGFLRLLYERGVPLVPGTDALIAGFSLHRELELWVRAGIPPAAALQAATLGAARVLREDHELGSIEVGKRADLVLLESDPTQDISAVRRAVLVVRAGRLIDPSAIRSALGIREDSGRGSGALAVYEALLGGRRALAHSEHGN
jgi:hypothetical protein